RPEVELCQPPRAVLGEAADEATGRRKSVGRHAEAPLRLPKLRLHRSERLNTVLRLLVQVPPAGPIRDEGEHTLRRPLRLEDRLVGAARDLLARSHTAISRDLAHPQLGP